MTTNTSPSSTRRDTLNLRISSTERHLIDRAAASLGTTRTEFILRAARRAAEDTLLEQALIMTSPEAYAEFLVRLDAPTPPNDHLLRTLRAPSPWAADTPDVPAP